MNMKELSSRFSSRQNQDIQTQSAEQAENYAKELAQRIGSTAETIRLMTTGPNSLRQTSPDVWHRYVTDLNEQLNILTQQYDNFLVSSKTHFTGEVQQQQPASRAVGS